MLIIFSIRTHFNRTCRGTSTKIGIAINLAAMAMKLLVIFSVIQVTFMGVNDSTQHMSMSVMNSSIKTL